MIAPSMADMAIGSCTAAKQQQTATAAVDGNSGGGRLPALHET
jgi:hypothetical protein